MHYQKINLYFDLNRRYDNKLYYHERTSENDGMNAPMAVGNVYYHNLYAGIFTLSSWLLDTTITGRLSS